MAVGIVMAFHISMGYRRFPTIGIIFALMFALIISLNFGDTFVDSFWSVIEVEDEDPQVQEWYEEQIKEIEEPIEINDYYNESEFNMSELTEFNVYDDDLLSIDNI